MKGIASIERSPAYLRRPRHYPRDRQALRLAGRTAAGSVASYHLRSDDIMLSCVGSCSEYGEVQRLVPDVCASCRLLHRQLRGLGCPPATGRGQQQAGNASHQPSALRPSHAPFDLWCSRGSESTNCAHVASSRTPAGRTNCTL